jgi:hypothetical protein
MSHRRKEDHRKKVRRRSCGKTSVRIVGDAEEIQSGYLQNTIQLYYSYINLPVMCLYLL